jgi:phage-related protein
VDIVLFLVHAVSVKLVARFYRTDTGEEPVRTWLLALLKADRRVLGEAVMRVQFGWPVGRPLCGSLGAGLYEVRQNISGSRIARVLFCFGDPNEIVLLHAFIKKTQKAPPSDLKLARDRCAKGIAMKRKNVGSNFEDFLAEDGILDDVKAAAIKAVFAAELKGAMVAHAVTEVELAKRMGSRGRGTVRRLLDPTNSSATLVSMVKAAAALGANLQVRLIESKPVRKRRAA